MQLETLHGNLPAVRGKVLEAVPQPEEMKKIALTGGETERIPLYRCDAPAFLEYAGGMPVLILEGGEAPQFFYLDRVVMLTPGTVFAVAPLLHECAVNVYLPSRARWEEAGQLPAEQMRVTPAAVPLDRVCTVFYQESRDSFYFKGEQHEAYELVYMDRGQMHNVLSGRDILLSGQELMLFDRNLWHTQYSDCAVGFLTVTFTLQSQILSPLCGRKLLPSAQGQAYLGQIMQEQRSQDTFSGQRIALLLQLLLIDLLRIGARAEKGNPPALPQTVQAENETIDRAVRYIARHIHTNVTLQELSAAVHVSVPYLCRVFTSHLGMPPGQYISRIRLEECKAALRRRECSIGEVARRFGFSSAQQFSRQFRRILGMTPSEYVRSLR